MALFRSGNNGEDTTSESSCGVLMNDKFPLLCCCCRALTVLHSWSRNFPPLSGLVRHLPANQESRSQILPPP